MRRDAPATRPDTLACKYLCSEQEGTRPCRTLRRARLKAPGNSHDPGPGNSHDPPQLYWPVRPNCTGLLRRRVSTWFGVPRSTECPNCPFRPPAKPPVMISWMRMAPLAIPRRGNDDVEVRARKAVPAVQLEGRNDGLLWTDPAFYSSSISLSAACSGEWHVLVGSGGLNAASRSMAIL